MKALPSIAFSGFRGTASEVTARQTGGRTVLSGRAQHSHVKTPKQSLRRANFAYISRLYRTLTEEQRRAWNILASAHREAALIGDGAPLTGHNLFVCLNTNRSVLGIPVTKDAPDNIHGSHYLAFDDIWITPGRLLISGLRDPEYPDSRLVVKMAETIHGNEYRPRTRITDNDLVDNERNSVSDLDIELTSGSPVVSAAGTLVGYDGIAASYAYFSPGTDIPYESGSLSSYILARGTETKAPQLFLMNIIRRSNENSIQFAHRGGSYSKPSDIVGGGLLM